jgi:hypothetical protein
MKRQRNLRVILLVLALLGLAAAVAEPLWRHEGATEIRLARELARPHPRTKLPVPYPAGAEDPNVTARDGRTGPTAPGR